MALFLREITSACFCRISQHQQVYLSTIEYQRASLRILPIENYNLPFMRPKIPYLSSLLVTCHQSSRLYGVFNMSCKPTNTATRTFNTFLGPPIRHLELQYVPSTTYTVTQLNNTPTTASIATHTFSSSIGPPTPSLRPSVRSWDHQH